MHVTASLAERYLSRGFALERPPLPPPFDFLAVRDGERVAGFASDAPVGAAAMVDVRIMARELGAEAVLSAPSFTPDARRFAERFSIALVAPQGGGDGDEFPASAPPQVGEEVTPPFLELHGTPAELPIATEVATVAHPTVHEFPEDPTPEELQLELAELNRLLDTPPPHPQATPLPVALHRPVVFVRAVAEERPEEPEDHEPFVPLGALPLDAFRPEVAAAEEEAVWAADDEPPAAPQLVEPDFAIADWYGELLDLEERTIADEQLVGWYEDVLALEAETVAEETRLSIARLAAAGRALAEVVAFGPTAGAAAAFRRVEDEIPVVAAPEIPVEAEVESEPAALPSPLPWTPAALAPPQPDADVEALMRALPDYVTTNAPPPREILPWVPAPLPPLSEADGKKFLEAFGRAPAWETLKKIEQTRREAHEDVVKATDGPKKTQIADDEDYELL